MAMQTVRKAVFPVAGMGTRFLPVTKASPKEMLPIVDKPLIQYAVEEAVAAGITEMIFITGRNKRAIEDHFDKAYELETELKARDKKALLDVVRATTPPGVSCIFLRQAEALGLGHAVLMARPVINNEPFAVILADDLIAGSPPVMQQMTALYDRHHCSILGTQRVPRAETSRYGIVSGSEQLDGMLRMSGIVEKPKPEKAPSDLAVVGRYILTPRIFHYLASIQAGAGGEIQLTDGIAALLAEESVYAYPFKGTRYDCGSKLGYLQATVDLALQHEEVGADFAAWLKARGGKA
jgi:UTP--glucose-1-phosphate uridylyltransferase